MEKVDMYLRRHWMSMKKIANLGKKLKRKTFNKGAKND
jgi:hypothetical protein